MKEALVLEAGGACCICGYRSNMRALHFHHVDPAKKRLRSEAVRKRTAAMLREMAINLVDDHRRDDDRRFALEIVPEGRCLGIFGQVFEPAGGVNEVEVRSAPRGHDNRLSI